MEEIHHAKGILWCVVYTAVRKLRNPSVCDLSRKSPMPSSTKCRICWEGLCRW